MKELRIKVEELNKQYEELKEEINGIKALKEMQDYIEMIK